ncbi:Inherit from bactNOG: Alpha beta hydrolase fold [Seminavis robusta]|uniref:Inherit from bactNOG: Alpha beta hydrolase fold n=1 Tax=Seminavis robusta TaxID=568900 RepID=A0A9N8DVG2_9STRA|nr:Inherit from bactNOG: Alpha beta hydrolase fold [Seminavis robusta]|eukprot:Sro306_g112970.1 Inherit from bactNOG: Alpha beta hydrolase fold (349) ;mRNA; r:30250-31296
MEKLEVQFPAGGDVKEDTLSGTFYLPPKKDQKFAAALVIHGSGPIDRDGNAEMMGGWMNMNMNTHCRLAEELVGRPEQPMAVLCYDKRGIGKSISSTKPNWYYEAGMLDLVQDAVQGYRYLVQQQEANVDKTQIFLMGHSEGAILLPLIAETIAKDETLPTPKGLVFLAGFGEALDEAAGNQRERALTEVAVETGLQGWVLRKVITREKVDKQYKDFMEQVQNKDQSFYSQYFGLAKVPTKWYREHMEWDAHASLQNCPLPCLAITGAKDVQVRPEFCDPEAAKTLAPSAASLETHVVANMTHILRSIEEPPSMLNMQKVYAKLGKQPLDPELLQILHAWLTKQQQQA